MFNWILRKQIFWLEMKMVNNMKHNCKKNLNEEKLKNKGLPKQLINDF